MMAAIERPDVEVLKASGKVMAWGGRDETAAGKRVGEDAVAWTHRKDDDTDIYFVSNQTASENTAEILFRVSDKVPSIWCPETGKQCRPSKWAKEGGRIKVVIPFTPFGSLFVLFRPKEKTPDNLETYRSEEYAKAIPLNRNWNVTFPKGFGEPEKAVVAEGSWTENPEFGIKYFSGTAVYETSIDVSQEQLAAQIALDLGCVKNIAEVLVNGTLVQTLWKPPFRCKINSFLKPGGNRIGLRITNTWWNRFVGDQQLPEDLEWYENLIFAGDDYRGYQLKEFPDWVWTGEQRPSKNRVTFSPWRFVEKDSELEPAGLIGPVMLLLNEQVENTYEKKNDSLQ